MKPRDGGAAVLASLLIMAAIRLCVVPAGKEFIIRNRKELSGNQEACRSRGEYGRYLAPLGVPPSTALSNALAEYERMHAHCLLADAGNANLTCNYLLYLEGSAGLGNRIMSLVSAFLYALLTHRVLLIDSRGHLPRLLCDPFSNSNSSWLAPPSFPYSKLLASSSDIAYHAQLHHDQSPLHQQFWTASTQSCLLSTPWLAWSSNQYLVPRFFTLPSLWPRLLPLFPSHPSLAFSHLARYLLLPADEAWRHVVDAYAAHLSGSNATAGLQVRQHFMKPRDAFSRAALDRIMECLTTHMEIVPEKENRTLAIMVASLQGRYYEGMKKAFKERHQELVSVHTLSQEKHQRHTWNQALKAFVEMWVMSMCDELATSSWSTFGYVARGLRGRPSWLLHIRADLMNTPLVCSLQQSPDPCNHFPFLPSKPWTHYNYSLLNTSSTILENWVNQHLVPCIDEHGGIQLIDN